MDAGFKVSPIDFYLTLANHATISTIIMLNSFFLKWEIWWYAQGHPWQISMSEAGLEPHLWVAKDLYVQILQLVLASLFLIWGFSSKTNFLLYTAGSFLPNRWEKVVNNKIVLALPWKESVIIYQPVVLRDTIGT